MNVKKFFVFILAFLIFIPKVEAEKNSVESSNKPRVMVVDCEIFENPALGDSRQLGTADYIVESLFESERFVLIDSYGLREEISEIQLSPNYNPFLGRALTIASRYNVDYIVYSDFDFDYGNSILIETKFKDGNFKSVKVTLIVHMLEVKTGRIVATAKGEGISKISEIEDQKNLAKNSVPQICLHNAAYKAARSATNNLLKNFSNLEGA